MAERVGFEPTEPVKAQQFSRLPDSTALAPLREPIILLVSWRIFQVEEYEDGLTTKIHEIFTKIKEFSFRANFVNFRGY